LATQQQQKQEKRKNIKIGLSMLQFDAVFICCFFSNFIWILFFKEETKQKLAL